MLENANINDTISAYLSFRRQRSLCARTPSYNWKGSISSIWCNYWQQITPHDEHLCLMPSGTFIKYHVTRLIKHQWVSCRGVCCYRVYQLIAQIYWIYLRLAKISCFLRVSIFPSASIWTSITEQVYLISFNEQWHWQWFNFGVTLSFRRRDGEHDDNHPIRITVPPIVSILLLFTKFNWTYAGNASQRLRPLSDLESLGARGEKKRTRALWHDPLALAHDHAIASWGTNPRQLVDMFQVDWSY